MRMWMWEEVKELERRKKGLLHYNVRFQLSSSGVKILSVPDADVGILFAGQGRACGPAVMSVLLRKCCRERRGCGARAGNQREQEEACENHREDTTRGEMWVRSLSWKEPLLTVTLLCAVIDAAIESKRVEAQSKLDCPELQKHRVRLLSLFRFF